MNKPTYYGQIGQTPDGVLRLFIDVSVDMDEMRTWSPERIAAFFNGLALAIEAKHAR